MSDFLDQFRNKNYKEVPENQTASEEGAAPADETQAEPKAPGKIAAE